MGSMVSLINKGGVSLKLREWGKWACRWDKDAKLGGWLYVMLFCQEGITFIREWGFNRKYS